MERKMINGFWIKSLVFVSVFLIGSTKSVFCMESPEFCREDEELERALAESARMYDEEQGIREQFVREGRELEQQRREEEENRLLREEQDRAYQLALEEDQRKEREREEVKRRKAEAHIIAIRKELDKHRVIDSCIVALARTDGSRDDIINCTEILENTYGLGRIGPIRRMVRLVADVLRPFVGCIMPSQPEILQEFIGDKVHSLLAVGGSSCSEERVERLIRESGIELRDN